MLTILLAILGGAFVLALISLILDEGFWEGFIVGGMLGSIVGVVIAGVLMFVNTATVTERGELSTMGDGLGTSGRFVLGTGTIDSQPVFMYYAKQADNSYVLLHAGAHISTVVQDDGMYYEVAKEVTNADPLWAFHMPPTVKHITFHVPKDSIKNNVVLDAQ